MDPRLGSWDSFQRIPRKAVPLFEPLGKNPGCPDSNPCKDVDVDVRPRISVAFYGEVYGITIKAKLLPRPLKKRIVTQGAKYYYLHMAPKSERFYYARQRNVNNCKDTGQPCKNSDNLDWYNK